MSTRKETQSEIEIAAFCAAAVILQYIDSAIPKPVPFMKYGLSHIVTLVVLYKSNLRTLFIYTFARVLTFGILSGTVFTPLIMLSAGGASASALVMSVLKKTGLFSVLGISIAGAAVNSGAQLLLINLLIVSTGDPALMVPVFALFASVSGTITGLTAMAVLKRSTKKKR